MNSKKPVIHLMYCRVLFLLFVQIRKGGLLALEGHVDAPDDPESIFSGYPELLEYPQHFNFMLDLLRLGLNGYGELPLLTLFGETARKSFLGSGGKDEALWDCIFASIKANFSMVSPFFSVEFGRQAIPYEDRPSFNEFEEYLKFYNREGVKINEDSVSRQEIETRIDEMFESMEFTNIYFCNPN